MADDGKRSLFSGGGGSRRRWTGRSNDEANGKSSLYSGGESHGPIKIDCARCGETSHVSVFDALFRLVRFSLWIPGRTYSHRLECPACSQRSWVRIRLV